MKLIYQDMSHKERVDLLTNQATHKAVETYSRTLTDAEIDILNRDYVKDQIQLQAIEEEMKQTMAKYKEKIGTLEKSCEEKLKSIRSRTKEESGMLYGIANHAEGRMLFYDQYGELINSRELLQQEKQGRIFQIGDGSGKAEGKNDHVEEAEVLEEKGGKKSRSRSKPKKEEQPAEEKNNAGSNAGNGGGKKSRSRRKKDEQPAKEESGQEESADENSNELTEEDLKDLDRDDDDAAAAVFEEE